MKKIVTLLLSAFMIFSFTACSPVVEKEKEPTPEEIIDKQEPVDMEKDKMAITEDFTDEVSTFVTYVLNTLYTKNETYTDEVRRDLMKDVSHSLYLDDLEVTNQHFDKFTESAVDEIQIGETTIASGLKDNNKPDFEEQDAFLVDILVKITQDGQKKEFNFDTVVLLEDGQFKFTNLYSKE